MWKNFKGNYVTSSPLFSVLISTLLLETWAALVWIGVYFPVILNNEVIRTAMAPFFYVVLVPRRLHYGISKSPGYGGTSRLLETIWSVLRAISYGLWIFTFVLTEVTYSVAFDLLRNFGLLVNLTSLVFSLRSSASAEGRQGDENAWGFGQAVPLFLLVLPLFALLEIVYGMYSQMLTFESRLLLFGPDRW